MQLPNEQYQYKRLTASGLVKNGAGCGGGFIVAQGQPTITVYNGTDTSGDLILNGMVVTASATPYPLPAVFTMGLYVVISGSADITFFYN